MGSKPDRRSTDHALYTELFFWSRATGLNPRCNRRLKQGSSLPISKTKQRRQLTELCGQLLKPGRTLQAWTRLPVDIGSRRTRPHHHYYRALFLWWSWFIVKAKESSRESNSPPLSSRKELNHPYCGNKGYYIRYEATVTLIIYESTVFYHIHLPQPNSRNECHYLPTVPPL
jgi:hypothetical protein